VTKVSDGHVVVGAGVMGLACALEIRRRGFEVTVFERGVPGREATWAAAGVVAPHHYEATPGPLYELLKRSRALYPTFIESLGAPDVGWHGSGAIALARTIDEAEELESRVAWLADDGYDAHTISRPKLRELEPACTAACVGAAFFSGDAYIDPRRLIAALEHAAIVAGVNVRSGVPVRAIQTNGERVTGIMLDDGEISSVGVILTAGAWSAGLAPGFRIPIRPIKGQMCSVRSDRLGRPIVYPDGVIMPRKGGLVAIGATVEDVGFDPRIDPSAIDRMRLQAVEMVPALADAAIVETWTGFRPRSKDGFPVIGKSPISGLVIASGHYTKGIAMAPVTAKCVADIVCDDYCDPLLAPFSPGRFV